MNPILRIRGIGHQPPGPVQFEAAMPAEFNLVGITYEHVVFGDASHDLMLLDDDGILVKPSAETPIKELNAHDGALIASLEIQAASAQPIQIEFFSLNEENPELTCEPTSQVVAGAIKLNGNAILKEDGSQLARRDRHGYWAYEGLRYSDVCFKPAVQ